MNAKDMMTPDPICCTPGMQLQEAAQLLARYDCGALPVVDDLDARQALGIITDRDIVVRTLAVGKDPTRLVVQDCMSGPCVTVDEEASVDDCCDTMEANQIRRLVVVDGEGRVRGIIAQADVAQTATEAKTAEVVREISLSAEAVRATF
jgi:CBS domain-containing protein